MTRDTSAQMRQRINNSIAAHRMFSLGLPPVKIAANLGVSKRSVIRYLDKPCPEPLEEELNLTDFYLQGACGEFKELDWASRSRRVQAEAKAICQYCPVLAKCRNYALNKGRDEQGIWAAMTQEERRKKSRQNQPQRAPAASAHARAAS